MPYRDLREWLHLVEAVDQVQHISGANWEEEIGAISEVSFRAHVDAGRKPPVLVFDDVPGCASGYRVASNLLTSTEQLAITMGLPLDLSTSDLVRFWRDQLMQTQPIEPVMVDEGPVMENIYEGDEVDLTRFPVPVWQELDGGRYIGTADAVITAHPEEGWVNLGTYRMQLFDRNTVGCYISPGKHGRIHRDMYLTRNEPVPIVASFGHDPLIFLVSSLEVPIGAELGFAGGIKGEPIEVIRGKLTGLPIPAHSEIVIEGEIVPSDLREEGPFTEWTGYYASVARPEPVVRVRRLLHRHQPILTGAAAIKPPNASSFRFCLTRSALVWAELEKAGAPEVQGVWCHEEGGGRLLTAVSIKQRYPGQARQVGVLASQVRSAAYLGRYVIVVDDDIDVTSLSDVMWAVSTRTDPEQDIEIMRRCWSGPLDPVFPPERKGFNSRAVIDACRPWEWKDRFPPVAGASPARKQAIMERWGKAILPQPGFSS